MQLEDALFIRVSPTQIKQVIINIIINGMEAMERRVALTQPDRKLMMQIRTVSEDDRAVICIRDEGTGMSPEDLKSAASHTIPQSPPVSALVWRFPTNWSCKTAARWSLKAYWATIRRSVWFSRRSITHEATRTDH